jgi:hypothetical protein
MYCPPKKFLPACWHLSRVLLESEVWVRPGQVGALFLHNLRVRLTFGHVMYPQNNSYTTWGCADSFGMLCTFKIMLHYSYTTWGCADDLGVFQAVCRKGLATGWWPFTGIDPFWVPGTTKSSCVQTETWCAGETLAMRLTWGCQWFVRLRVLFFAFNIYTLVGTRDLRTLWHMTSLSLLLTILRTLYITKQHNSKCLFLKKSVICKSKFK